MSWVFEDPVKIKTTYGVKGRVAAGGGRWGLPETALYDVTNLPKAPDIEVKTSRWGKKTGYGRKAKSKVEYVSPTQQRGNEPAYDPLLSPTVGKTRGSWEQYVATKPETPPPMPQFPRRRRRRRIMGWGKKRQHFVAEDAYTLDGLSSWDTTAPQCEEKREEIPTSPVCMGASITPQQERHTTPSPAAATATPGLASGPGASPASAAVSQIHTPYEAATSPLATQEGFQSPVPQQRLHLFMSPTPKPDTPFTASTIASRGSQHSASDRRVSSGGPAAQLLESFEGTHFDLSIAKQLAEWLCSINDDDLLEVASSSQPGQWPNAESEAEWKAMVRATGRWTYVAEGAFKKVYRAMWGRRPCAVAVMDAFSMADTGNGDLLAAEVKYSLAAAELGQLHGCNNFVAVYGAYFHKGAAHEGLFSPFSLPAATPNSYSQRRRRRAPGSGRASSGSAEGTPARGSCSPGPTPPTPDIVSPAGRSAFAALPDLSTVLLLEWCNGGDVEELLRKQASGALAIDEAAYQAALPRFIAELLTPLALLHGSGSSNSSDRQPCVHLDVKLLNYFGVIEAASQSTKGFDAARLRFKLGDFGTADVGDGSKQVEVKHYTTLENLSPEMYVLGDAVALTPAIDGFAMGLCILHLVTGVEPYEEWMEKAVCPPAVRKALLAVWDTYQFEEEEEEGCGAKEGRISFHALATVLNDGGEDQVVNTLWRFAVLLGLPGLGNGDGGSIDDEEEAKEGAGEEDIDLLIEAIQAERHREGRKASSTPSLQWSCQNPPRSADKPSRKSQLQQKANTGKAAYEDSGVWGVLCGFCRGDAALIRMSLDHAVQAHQAGHADCNCDIAMPKVPSASTIKKAMKQYEQQYSEFSLLEGSNERVITARQRLGALPDDALAALRLLSWYPSKRPSLASLLQ